MDRGRSLASGSGREGTSQEEFAHGTEGEIDLEPELVGPMFEPLKDLDQFKLFRVYPEFHTLVWLNGADLAPEFLYQHVRVTA